MNIKDFISNILIGVLGGLVSGIILTYILKPYLDQKLAKDQISRILRSEGFMVFVVIIFLVILSIFKPSTAPYIYGHGLGSYSYVREMEKIYSLIPLMKKELKETKSAQGYTPKESDLIDLDLQERNYYISFNRNGTYSYKGENPEQAIRFTGIHKVYYPNGQVYSEAKFVEGDRLEEGYKSYYCNGKIRAELIKDKTLIGSFPKIIRYYYNNGSIWCEYRYYDEHRLLGLIYDRNGNIVEQGDHVFYAILVPGYYQKIQSFFYDPSYSPMLSFPTALSSSNAEEIKK